MKNSEYLSFIISKISKRLFVASGEVDYSHQKNRALSPKKERAIDILNMNELAQ